MKKIIAILLILLPVVAIAQTSEKHDLMIDASSFAPVQQGALDGVAIDKISPDPSKRPCARIKMHINRMKREEIAELKVKSIGGGIAITKSIVATEGNGLIIELTAKPETRIYLHHDEYGDSNEVTLNLEGNKEYRINAELRAKQSIVINAGVEGAEVYLDNEYVGTTSSIAEITIEDVIVGKHNVRVEYGTAKCEQSIDVSPSSIIFRVEVDTSQARAQHVVLNVKPSNASVLIDGKSYPTDQDGYATVRLPNGTHSYTVSAKYYHSKSETFIVEGQKRVIDVSLSPAHGWLNIKSESSLNGADIYIDDERVGTAPLKSDMLASGVHKLRIVKDLYEAYEGNVTITDGNVLDYTTPLKADYAIVTISSKSGSMIYVDDIYKGPSPWSGKLRSGYHTFEARMDGHTSQFMEKNITPEPNKEVNYTIPDPEPICGWVDITSSPNIATVMIDGKKVGETPLAWELIIGKHIISISKDGYNSVTREVIIKKGETTPVDVTLSHGMGELEVRSTPSGAMVMIDSKSEGFTPLTKELSPGSHTVYISKSGYKSVTRNVNIEGGKTTPLYISLTSTEATPSYSSSASSSSKSSSSSSSSSKSRYRPSRSYRSWDERGFNIGAYFDGSYAGSDTQVNSLGDEEEVGVFGIGVGLNWRLWHYYSWFQPMIGMRYKYFTNNTHFVGFPISLNFNWARLFDNEDLSAYSGIGVEPCYVKENYVDSDGDVYDSYSQWDYSFVLNILGFGTRNLDVNWYFNVNLDTELLFTGVRITYFF